MYILPRSGGNFLLAACYCFLVWFSWLVQRVLSSTFDPKEILAYLGWPKLHVEFGSSHKKFDVWPRLLEVYLRIVKGDSPLQKLKGVWAQVISAMISGIVWAPNARVSQVFFSRVWRSSAAVTFSSRKEVFTQVTINTETAHETSLVPRVGEKALLVTS